MTDDLVRLPVIGRILRRRWPVLVTWAVLGALLGAGASLVLSPGYEASTTVLLQGPREENELVTEAQVATSSVVLDRTAAALGSAGTVQQLRDSVTASVVNGGVIEISATADDPVRAKRIADTVSEEYVSFATQLVTNSGDASAQLLQEQRATLRQQVEASNRRISELHRSAEEGGMTVESVQARTELEALRGELEEAIKTLDEAEAAAVRANMAVLGPAPLPTSQAPPTLVHLVGGGALLGLLLAIVAQLFAIRTDRRLRDPQGVAAALGAPVLGGVDAPTAESGGRASVPVRRRLWRLLWDDRPWDADRRPPRNADAVDERYRRVLAKVRGFERLLVLVPTGDDGARRSADRLGAAVSGPNGTALEVVEVSADRPSVPEGRGSALVVITSRTRTALDLAALAAACAEAGREVAGAVLVGPAEPVPGRVQGLPEGSAAGALAGAP